MENSTFWAIFIIVLVVGIALGIAYTTSSMTGKAIWDKLLPTYKVPETTVPVSESPVAPTQPAIAGTQLPITYQGVLNMLNKCTIVHIMNNFTNISCNNVCQQQAKTCVQAFTFDPVSEITIPYECSWMKGTNRLYCNCCSAPILNAAEVTAIKSFKETGQPQIYQIDCNRDCCWTERVMCCWYGGCESGCCWATR
ncbi:MAG: hypothetical protein QXK80_01510 [Candidatus Pacearchaeota archaeon]